MKIEIKVQSADLDKIRKDMKKRIDSVKKTVKRELPTYLTKIQTTAQNIIQNEAYDTGRLYNSIVVDWNPGTMSGNVKADDRVAKNSKGQGYAEYVEFGHYIFPHGNMNIRPRWIPGVYFMTRALSQNKSYRKVAIAKIKDSFKHYYSGGEWMMSTRTGPLRLNGISMQKMYKPKSTFGRIASRRRKYVTSRKRATRARRMVRL